MKSTVADREYIVYCVRIESAGGSIVRLVAYPFDLTMSNGEVYKTDSGYQFTGFNAKNNLSPSVIDLEGILAVAGVSRADIMAGVWDDARAYTFATSWAAPVDDEEPIAKFIVGKVRLEDSRYVAELMHLIDAVNQSVGRTFGPLCPWTLYDETLDGETLPYQQSRCTGPRSAPDGPSLAADKVTGTVTHVTSRSVWRDSSRAEAADHFGAGAMRFTSGNNSGVRSQEIKSHAANGTITLFLDMPYDIQVGDSYEMIPGCRKRFSEDCQTKHSNGINFGGFPSVPASSQYGKYGTGDA
ncbi:MAG TPA: hypothetical protein DCZ13_04420 [Porticoccaceae bacterium]|nr:hypothetical protein [Porticoccaceae bacterium]